MRTYLLLLFGGSVLSFSLIALLAFVHQDGLPSGVQNGVACG